LLGRPLFGFGPPGPVAVIDIGSNSGRVVVYDVQASGHLPILASSRASLRLVRDLKGKALSPQAIKRTMEALKDFRAIAVGSGARRTVAVATSAVRDATNGPALLEAVRKEVGIELRVLSGAEEAQAGFLGAVRGLPVEHGAQFDVGGGSAQVCLFHARRLGAAWSFPLGSLRLSDAFLTSDPPSQRAQDRLVEHVQDSLADARLERLPSGAALVGTGGTVRNLAKIDQRRCGYPIARLHGYQLSRKSVREIVSMLAARPAKRRAAVPGLNDDRADSIVGGGLVVLTLMKVLGAGEVQVSGQGVREGLAASLVSEQLPPPVAVRESSVAALAGAFRRWDARSAKHRMQIADALFRALEGDGAPELREMVQHGARLLDVGRSIDFFDRHEHVADIVLATDLLGFSHRGIALLSAVVRGAGDEESSMARYGPLLDKRDRDPVARAATLLALADEIEERCPDGANVKVSCKLSRDEARIAVSGLAGWQPRRIASRFERAFGRRLVVTTA
jgi:exopolyphosphatase/guanosine-5'-triphosphate,3'-diphosphate pyrophosphatase